MALNEEDLPRRPPSTHVIGQDLADLSIEELKLRIESLRHEIARLQAAIDAKSAHRNAAADVFRL